MIEATAPPSKPSSRGRRVWDAVAAYPDAAIGVYALVAIAALIAAYFAIFTVFAPYDDEGTLLVTVKAFANGGTLYSDVHSPYGPFYYELFGGLFALTGKSVTTDASRTIVMLLWVATSLTFGIGAQRLTGRLALGVAGMLAAFAALYVLVNEPMHPHGLCALLLGGFLLLAVWEPRRRIGWSGASAGLLLAALLMTKINLGAFAIAAVAIAAVWTVGPLYRRGWLRLAVTAAFLALPLAIMARDLGLPWVRELVVLEGLAMVAILIAGRPLRPEPGDEEASLVRWLAALAAGFAIAVAAIVGIILLIGTSPADLYDGMVTQGLRIRDLLVIPFAFPPAALDWAIVSAVAAVLVARLRPLAVGTIWTGLLRAAAGLAILCALAHIAPFRIGPSAGNPNVVPMVLAWVAAVPLAAGRESAHRRFLRLLLPALAVAETLQVYPVAGSQLGIASIAFVPVAMLCLADALSDLRTWASLRGVAALGSLATVAGIVTIALAGTFALSSILLPGATNAQLYRDQPSLPLPGAQDMHLPQASVDLYTGLVGLLHRHRCTTFVGYPSIDSLYLWSGLEGPAPQLPNAWMKAFDGAQQQRVVDQLRASPRPCAIRSGERANAYLGGEAPPDLPLVRYVFDDFRPVAQIEGYEFLLPKPSATAPRP